ncbi:uncharacterized protein LOC111830199 [Capsella rubella]|uniref:uncharacterized protein LOC111830199 n=1 Tax=Capsella rubella TaxID=81985 RepID=UPI000CD4F9A0|nr:uncharacterized protein LOC111830199 [Capsella rubella]
MFYRHLARDGTCMRCSSGLESVNHLLFQCHYARLVWALSPIPAPPESEWSDSIYYNMHRVLNIHEFHPQLEKDRNIVPWILWRLWKSRNDSIFKGKDYDAQSVLRRASEDEEEWKWGKEKQNQTSQVVRAETQETKWKPPPQNWVKCNTDGAWNIERPTCGIGWILRNHDKEVLWLGVRALPRVNTVLEAESEALRWTVISMMRLNYRNVLFESDSQQLVSLVKGESEMQQVDPIIQDIKQMLQHFQGVKLTFIKRESNGVADRIAKESFSLGNNDPILYSITPSWLKSQVEIDNV